MTSYYQEYSKYFVAVDCIIFGFDEGELRILIGKRKLNPGRGQWSLYGGFVREEESIDDAANRVLFELTGLRNIYMRQLGAFGNINRDPGERVISVAYYALINVNDYSHTLLEEHSVEWVSFKDIPTMYSDHNKMIALARSMMQKTISSEPISFNLLPELFTLTQLQRLYEAVCGEEVDKRNFRKRVKEMAFIEKTDFIDKTGSKRGAYLYRFNQKAFQKNSIFKL